MADSLNGKSWTVLHVNLRDKAPPFKGGDPVFKSRVSFIWGYGGIGRRRGLKIPWPYGRVGSSPTTPTKN